MESNSIFVVNIFNFIEKDWNDLVSKCTHSNFFMEFDWNRHWWDYYGKNHGFCNLESLQYETRYLYPFPFNL